LYNFSFSGGGKYSKKTKKEETMFQRRRSRTGEVLIANRSQRESLPRKSRQVGESQGRKI
jgi:hypothetical protein